MCCMHPWPAPPDLGPGGCSRCPCSTHTVAVAMRALSTPPTWLLFALGALCGIGQPNANHTHQVGAGRGLAGGAQRWPKEGLWHVGPLIWDSEHHFGENEDPQNLGHQGASGAVLPCVACGLPNVDVGLTNRPIRNDWIFFSAGTQSPTNNIKLN